MLLDTVSLHSEIKSFIKTIIFFIDQLKNQTGKQPVPTLHVDSKMTELNKLFKGNLLRTSTAGVQ